MIIIRSINDNIIIFHPYYSGVYQDEDIELELYKDINNVLGLEQKNLIKEKYRLYTVISLNTRYLFNIKECFFLTLSIGLDIYRKKQDIKATQ